MERPRIDLNADLGEEITDDEALLAVVTSANVACGYHAGSHAVMRAVCAEAARRDVTLGAQVSYDDRENFGRVDRDVSYVGELLPAVTVFALGLSIVVAPQTAVVLADADERNAGAASGVNNAIGRIAALLGVAGYWLVLATGFSAELDRRLDPSRLSPAARLAVSDAKANPMAQPDLSAVPATERPTIRTAIGEASVSGLHLGAGAAAGVVILAGLLGVGLRNPRRAVAARECAGGPLVAAPRDAARRPEECEAQVIGVP